MFSELKRKSTFLMHSYSQLKQRRQYLLQKRQELILRQQKNQKHEKQPINHIHIIQRELISILNNNEQVYNENNKNNDVAYIILYSETNTLCDYYRLRNLYYTILLSSKISNFNIYITEVGKSKSKKLKKILNKFKNFDIKHNLIINNTKYFDRAHSFNCSIKHFIDKEEILIMGDCDLPLHENINKLISFIKLEKYFFISPYTNLTKLTENNTINYYKNQILDISNNITSNLYTITGGILIANRRVFENLGLWFEYSTYGNEDRALDVILLEKYKDKIFIDNYNYIHLWHPRDNININYPIVFNNKIYYKDDYHNILFNCFCCDKDRKTIHSKCKHNTENIWGDEYNKQKKGNLNKYKNFLV
jgi:hypothetical protein